jgi:hypothetical protein
MKKFKEKVFPKISNKEHKERINEGRKYAKFYDIFKALGKSEKESRSMAAIVDPVETIKNKI